jgi:ribosomal protein L7/L12
MSDTVGQILELFDALDAYEAIDLVHLLAQRGYSLKLDKISSPDHFYEPESGYDNLGIVLASFKEMQKIRAIKAVRSIHENYRNLCSLCKDFTLKEAKDYVEMNYENRKQVPICCGKKPNIEKILFEINISPEIMFETVNIKNIQ